MMCIFRTARYTTVARSFSSHAPKDTFHQKSPYEVWFGDRGAYPMIGIVGMAMVMVIVVGIERLQHPDIKWHKKDRKSTIRWDIIEN